MFISRGRCHARIQGRAHHPLLAGGIATHRIIDYLPHVHSRKAVRSNRKWRLSEQTILPTIENIDPHPTLPNLAGVAHKTSNHSFSRDCRKLFLEDPMGTTPIAQVRVLMANNESIGMGFNSVSGLAVGTPFDVDNIIIEPDPSAPGQTVTSTITLINTHDELMESVGLSVDAAGRYGFFSAALKAQFADESAYNSTSTFLLAKVLVQNPFTRGRNFGLTPDATGILGVPGTGHDTFQTAFGDSFVRGLQTGGEFYAVIRITSISTSKERDLASTLEAEFNGLAASGSFQGAFNQANQEESTRSEFNAVMYQRAGTGEEIAPTLRVDDVLSRVKKFPTIVLAHPVAYETEVATYNTIPLPTPTPEEQADFAIDLSDAQGKKLHYVQTKNDLEFARANPEFFENLPAADVLRNAIEIYTQLANAVMQHGRDLANGSMNPPRLFDPGALDPPLIEPAPIPLTRVTPVLPATTMPDLVDADVVVMGNLLSCLDHGGALDECLAGTAFLKPGTNPDPIVLSDDIIQFLNMYFKRDLTVTWIPGDPDDLIKPGSPLPGFELAVESQFPAAGTMVNKATQIVVQIISTG
jgi:hypothetical protein